VKLAFYPGCALESSAKEYKESTLLVARSLGLDMKEIPDWICCGATAAHMSDDVLAVALPAYDLVRARGMGADTVVASCAACYSRMRSANYELKRDPGMVAKVAEVLGERYEGDVDVRHFLEIVNKVAESGNLEAKIKAPLEGLRIASYYGCLLVRPAEVTGFDDREDPRMMDRLAARMGAEPLDWRYKVECCGASLAFSRPDVADKLSGDILQDAKHAGADLVMVACPLCHSNLDLRQGDVEKRIGADLEIPVLYFTQVLGLALGHTARDLGINKHMINPLPLLKKRGIKV
jgi:heterodisulfide reductase subunit B